MGARRSGRSRFRQAWVGSRRRQTASGARSQEGERRGTRSQATVADVRSRFGRSKNRTTDLVSDVASGPEVVRRRAVRSRTSGTASTSCWGPRRRTRSTSRRRGPDPAAGPSAPCGSRPRPAGCPSPRRDPGLSSAHGPSGGHPCQRSSEPEGAWTRHRPEHVGGHDWGIVGQEPAWTSERGASVRAESRAIAGAERSDAP